ncbi:hypothetical protein O6H91_09G031800 [Diphasiastrum complanatum]|uniref:Uncharacterized protein n=1 Tax=Diphasiastrum complanatum TaxID=34168 RepID=A0ACC2CMQ3_DIPCM|nr:hypothetical protein O6H91_09G031800 [Diphasiastrum complanatum]
MDRVAAMATEAAAFPGPYCSTVSFCGRSSLGAGLANQVAGLRTDIAFADHDASSIGRSMRRNGRERRVQAIPVCLRGKCNNNRQWEQVACVHRLRSIRKSGWQSTLQNTGICCSSGFSIEEESTGTASGCTRLKRGTSLMARVFGRNYFPRQTASRAFQLWTAFEVFQEHQQAQRNSFGNKSEIGCTKKNCSAFSDDQVDLASPERPPNSPDLHHPCLEYDRSNQNTYKHDYLRSCFFFLASTFLILFMGLRVVKPAFAQTTVAPPTKVEEEQVKDEHPKMEQEGTEEGKSTKKISDALLKEIEKYLADAAKGAELPPEVVFQAFIEQHPDDVEAHQALLLICMQRGEAGKALPLVEKLIILQPDEIEWKYIRAQALDLVGDMGKARQAFEEILKLEPLSARALQGAAITMQKTGEGDRAAIEMLQAAIKKAASQNLFKEARNLRMLLGQILTLQGNLEQALLEYDNLVKDEPGDFRPFLCQGLIYSIEGKSKEAEEKFEDYRRRCPKDFPNRKYLDALATTAKAESHKVKQE